MTVVIQEIILKPIKMNYDDGKTKKFSLKRQYKYKYTHAYIHTHAYTQHK